MEQLQGDVNRILLTLEKSDLISVCGEGQHTVIRLLEKTLTDVEEEEEDPESFQLLLQHLLFFVSALKQQNPSALENVKIGASEIDTLKEKYNRLQQEQSEAQRLLETKNTSRVCSHELSMSSIKGILKWRLLKQSYMQSALDSTLGKCLKPRED